MEALPAKLFIEESKIDLNQIANLVINHITESVSKNIIYSVKELLENHFPKQEEKIEYYTQKEAMDRLKISRSTFFQRERRGIIERDGWNGRRPLYSIKQIENLLNDPEYIGTYNFNKPLNE
ncbi:hypothetical protein [uncultured Psychroserpens sp.]|uniref:hypothetical protein n=1 Tax=uncultured Psychroserpens sp. TaxID=255436 RepID=UPI00260E9806|nr:hypothetical protein [uncultured Psychroserpens sp.]